MIENLKKEVFQANLDLVKYGLVIFTWGNVSARCGEYIVIKPSGVSYETMKAEDMVVLDLDGNRIEGNYNPSSDTPTHLELYKAFPGIGGITHTHSSYATSFAQAGMPITPMGTTHADYFYGTIPCTRNLSSEETESAYEKNTGKVIIETFEGRDPIAIPGVIVRNHGVFSWGKDAFESVHNAVVMEEVAKMNYRALTLNPSAGTVRQYILDKHYYRKHGENSYYGQKEKEVEK